MNNLPKLIKLFCLLFVSALTVSAQHYTDTVSTFYELKAINDAYFDSIRAARELQGIYDMKGTGFSKYQQWLMQHKPYAAPDRTLPQIRTEMQRIINRHINSVIQLPDPEPNPNSSQGPPLWSEIGPSALSTMDVYHNGSWSNGYLAPIKPYYNPAGVGRVDVLYRDLNSSNPIFACGGGEGGGLFIGFGNSPSWISAQTDNIPFSRVRTIAKHPTDDYWFIGIHGSGRLFRAKSPTSFSSNNPWRPIGNGVLPGEFQNNNITLNWWSTTLTKVEFSATGRLFAATENGLYYSDNSNINQPLLVSWTQCPIPQTLNPTPMPLPVNLSQYPVSDVKTFQKTVNGVVKNFVVASVYAKYNDANAKGFRYHVFLSDDDGLSWTNITGTAADSPSQSLNSDTTGSVTGVKLTNFECLKQDPSFIYFSVPDTQSIGYFNIFKYDFSTWQKIRDNVNGSGIGQVVRTEARMFGMNPTNENQLFVFINSAARSNDGGNTWTTIKAGGQTSDDFHADVRDIEFTADGNNILLATDGGVFKYNITGNSYIPVSEGLGLSQPLNQFDVYDRPPYYVGAGFYHSGIQIFNPNAGKWHTWWNGDGSELKFDRFNGSFYAASFDSSIRYTTSFDSPSLGSSYNLTSYNEYASDNAVEYPEIYPSEHTEGEAYGVSNFIYKKVAGLPGFSNTPCLEINQKLIQGEAKLTSLWPVPNDDDMFYITFMRGLDNTYHIWKVDDIDSPNPIRTWINNSPFIVEAHIEVDRFNPDVFYAVGKNNEFEDNTKKIYKYDNGTWVDLAVYPAEGFSSSSFPWYVHVFSIKQDRGTGILYIGTSEGIFYLDTQNGIWKRHGYNLPFGENTDIKINHCEGFIYTSIFGRGIWKAPLVELEAAPIEITGTNNTWSTPRNIYSDIIVRTGAKLKITSEVLMAENRKIIVEPAAILEVVGGKISDLCGGPWKGIELWGNSAQPQTYGIGGFYPQAKLILSNATLENAENAVTTWKPEDWTKTGGLIQASNSTFKNNKRSVEFRIYQFADKSYFTNCTFLNNNFVAGSNQYATNMVTAENISGIRFIGCRFSQEGNTVPAPTGIYTHNARFLILPGNTSQTYPPPPSTYVPTRFLKLNTGIRSLNGNTLNFSVDTALFERCNVGIDVSNVNQFEILRSRFRQSTNALLSAGIRHVEGTGFKIENNYFEPYPNSLVTMGIVSDNTGPLANQIYNNTFVGNRYGHIAYKTNWSGNFGKMPDKGLKLYCNQNTNNVSDFTINNNASIGYYQGSVTMDPITNLQIYTPAGNTFTLSPSLADGHINNAGLFDIQYVHHNQAGSAFNVEPVNISTGVIKVQASSALLNRDQYCPSKLPGTDIEIRKLDALTDFQLHKQAYDNIHYIYHSLLNGGQNPEHIIQNIQYAWPSEVWELRTGLLAGSPFLTMDVLYELADNTEVIPHAIQLEIFMANPHCARDSRFLYYLANKDVPMPAWMIDLLTGAAGITTQKDELENGMAYHGDIWEYAGNEIAKSLYAADTILGFPADSLEHWYRIKNAPELLVDLYAGLRRYNDAVGLIDSLRLADSLAKIDCKEWHARRGLYTLLADFEQNSGNEYWKLDSMEQEQLLLFAGMDNLPAHTEARNILAFYYGYNFTYTIETPQPKSMPAPKPKHPVNMQAASQTLKVYPNPSQGQTIFEYRYPALTETLYLSIYGSQGGLLQTIKLNGQSGVYIWNAENYAQGSYLYKISSGNVILDSGVIQLNK